MDNLADIFRISQNPQINSIAVVLKSLRQQMNSGLVIALKHSHIEKLNLQSVFQTEKDSNAICYT